MGTSTDRFDYLGDKMRAADKADPEYEKQKALYRKIRQFCTTCNTPDEMCIASVCHFYSLKVKAISEDDSANRKFGAYANQRLEFKGQE